MNTQDPVVAKAIAQSLGTELRRRREACGLSRADFASKLPSGYCDRSVFHLERGDRPITVLRLLELCDALEDPPNSLVARAVHNANDYLANLALPVDLRKVLTDRNMRFGALAVWARNRMNDAPDGVAEVSPSSIREVAAFIGQTPEDLTHYLTGFRTAPPSTVEEG